MHVAMCEYLRLEGWQRWEGNQLLHTERRTLCPAHLETDRHSAPGPDSVSLRGCVGTGRGALTEGSSHGVVQRGLCVPRGQVRPRVVPALVIVILDVKACELGHIDAESAAGIIDVLAVQRLQREDRTAREARKVATWGKCDAGGGCHSPAWHAGRSQGLRTAAVPETGCSW